MFHFEFQFETKDKMRGKQSVYSKMYLVSPNVYDKVLQNLDDKLKKTTEELNIEKETEDRPSEKILEDISAQELQAGDLSENPNPFIDPEPEQGVTEPESFEQSVSEPTFGQREVESGEIMPENAPPIVDNPVGINPLKTSCAQPEVQDQFIPLIRKQGVVKTRVKRLNEKKTPQKEVASTNPNIRKVQVTRPEPLAMIKDIKIKPKKFICNICLKGFHSSYHLNRHISSVHKNLTQNNDEQLLQTQPQTIPDDDDQMLESEMSRPVFPRQSTSTKQFENWGDKKSQPIKSKRKTGDAKLKYTPRPTKTRPGDDWFDSWSNND